MQSIYHPINLTVVKFSKAVDHSTVILEKLREIANREVKDVVLLTKGKRWVFPVSAIRMR